MLFFFKIEKEYTSKLACMYIENAQKDEAKWQNQLPLCGEMAAVKDDAFQFYLFSLWGFESCESIT